MTGSQAEKLIAKVRSLALALPEAKEVEAWGHPTFRAPKKMFAACGWDEKTGEAALGLCIGHDRQEELLGDPRFFPTPYAAHRGWVSLALNSKTNWTLVKQLLCEAFCRVAAKRLAQQVAADEQWS